MIDTMLSRHGTRRLGASYRFAAMVLKPPMTVFTKRDWQGTDWLRRDYPPDDGIVVVANHISWFDPIPLAHILWNNGRPPRFLAKEAVFEVPFAGWIIGNAGQIPVFRETQNAADAVRAAVDAVHDGEAVVVYPEGTITRDPDLWPMKGKTGAARIALLGEAPVIPIAMWGPQDVMGPYAKEFKMIPPKTMRLRVGPPVELDDLRGQELTTAVLTQSTERIMDAITVLLEEIRGEPAPPQRLDFKTWREQQQKNRSEEK
jgi:1-acyl-sn-glycerol-3-phosphate acyltransferase